MCQWLTIAAPDREALLPLRAIGADCESADFPQLPPQHRTLQRFLVTRGGCACDLLAAKASASLEAALTQARLTAGVLLAHRTFGDPPRGGKLHAPDRRSPREFAAARDGLDDRWVTIDVAWTPEQPPPRQLDGARVLAVGIDARDATAPLYVLLVYPHVPGCTLARCDRDWQRLDADWHPDEASARAAVPGPVRWTPRD